MVNSYMYFSGFMADLVRRSDFVASRLSRIHGRFEEDPTCCSVSHPSRFHSSRENDVRGPFPNHHGILD